MWVGDKESARSSLKQSSRGKRFESSKKSAVGMSQSSLAKSVPNDEIEDEYESFQDHIEDQPGPKKSDSIPNSLPSSKKEKSFSESIKENFLKPVVLILTPFLILYLVKNLYGLQLLINFQTSIVYLNLIYISKILRLVLNLLKPHLKLIENKLLILLK